MDGLSPVQFSAAQTSAVGLSSIQSQHKRSHPAMDAAAKLLGMSSGGRLAAVGDDHVQHHCLTRRHKETAGRGGGKAAGCFMSVTGRSADCRRSPAHCIAGF